MMEELSLAQKLCYEKWHNVSIRYRHVFMWMVMSLGSSYPKVKRDDWKDTIVQQLKRIVIVSRYNLKVITCEMNSYLFIR